MAAPFAKTSHGPPRGTLLRSSPPSRQAEMQSPWPTAPERSPARLHTVPQFPPLVRLMMVHCTHGSGIGRELKWASCQKARRFGSWRKRNGVSGNQGNERILEEPEEHWLC